MNKQAVQVLYVDLLYSYELIVLYGPPKPSFGRSPFFFFSGLMTGPTYRPLVRHSNPDTPLIWVGRSCQELVGLLPTLRNMSSRS